MSAPAVAWQDGRESGLFWQAWSPAEPRAALLLVHGLAEHSGRYAHVARRFAAAGYASVAIDYRGHGRSPGPRVHIESFEDWCDDVALGLALTRRMHAGRPVIVVGHSQGGLIVILQALRGRDERLATVVSSPLLGVAPPSRPGPALRLASRILLRLAPRLLVPNNVNPDWLSHDPAVGRAYRGDPLVSHKVSAGWHRALRHAMSSAHAQAGAWGSPLLVVASHGDHIVDAQAVAAWVARTRAGEVDALYWDDLHHELFNETRNEEVFAAVEKWLEGRVARR